MNGTHEEMKDSIAAYVVGAVPSDEVAAIRAHILSCEECLGDADAYSTAAGALALSVEPVDTPPGFADRVMSRIETHAPAPARERRWRWSFEQVFSFAALIIAIVVLSVALVNVRQDLDSNRRVLTAMVHGEGAIDLTGRGGVARIVPTADGAILAATGLSAAPDGHTYQLWVMEGDCAPDADGPCEITSAGTFDVSDGIGILKTPVSLEGVDRAAVTVEVAGGAEQPTSDPIMDSA